MKKVLMTLIASLLGVAGITNLTQHDLPQETQVGAYHADEDLPYHH